MTEVRDRRFPGGGTDNGPVADLPRQSYPELLARLLQEENRRLGRRLDAVRGQLHDRQITP